MLNTRHSSLQTALATRTAQLATKEPGAARHASRRVSLSCIFCPARRSLLLEAFINCVRSQDLKGKVPRRYAVAQDEHVKERLRTWVSSFVLDVPEAAAATNRARAATGAAVTA